MNVGDAMSRDPKIMSPEDTIREAASRMRSEDVGALPVGENDRLVGMVTDRDIATRAVAEGSGSDTPIRSVMSETVYYCFEDTDLSEAARTMAEHQVQRLPVLNREKRLVGMLAVADLARNEPQTVATALRGIAEPTAAPRN